MTNPNSHSLFSTENYFSPIVSTNNNNNSMDMNHQQQQQTDQMDGNISKSHDSHHSNNHQNSFETDRRVRKTHSSSTPNQNLKSLLKKSHSFSNISSSMITGILDPQEDKFSTMQDLNEYIGQIYSLSKYQQGCRFLQKKLSESNPKNTALIFEELCSHLTELMIDPFGNYLLTKLIEQCDADQRNRAIQSILPELNTTALNIYGTQSLQKIISYLSEHETKLIFDVLEPKAVILIKHIKANYLVQYCLEHLTEQQNAWVYNAVSQNAEELCKDKVGCVIVKKCIDHSVEFKDHLVSKILDASLVLVQDPFGNYVIQHILDRVSNQIEPLLQRLVGCLPKLCVQKFSSNVVEKCLRVAKEETKKLIIFEISANEVLPQLLNDKFGNFVIQTALDSTHGEIHAELVKKILPLLNKTQSTYSKNVQKKIFK